MNFLLYIEGGQGLQTLERLLDHTTQITVVVPDGFGNTAIETICEERGLECVTRLRGVPLDLSQRSFDVLVSSQFQFRILPGEYEAAGQAINIHASILPTYRGKHSDVWALINDEETLGISVHRLNERFDDGEILLIEQVRIDDSLTNADIYARVRARIPGIVDQIADGSIFDKLETEPRQDIYWRVRKPIDSQIQWHLSARKVFLFVRALGRAPIYAYSRYRRVRYEFQRVSLTDARVDGLPGTVIALGDGLHVVCGDGHVVRVEDVVSDGRPLAAGMVLH